VSTRLIRDLTRQVGEHQVYDRPADLAAYAYDSFGASGDRHLPDAVVFPASTEEVAGVVQVCAYHGVPVVPRGAGTGYSGGALALHGGVILNLVRMDAVRGLETDAQRIHAEAGVVTSTVHHRAAERGLYYPPDPGAATTSTIGGNVACNAGGPHALRYGVTGDFVTGLVAVTADGSVLRLGEAGSGATDLMRLLIGSEGTLAVVTEAVLRLLPAPAARSTLAAVFEGMEPAAAAVAQLSDWKVVPAAFEFLDRGALQAVAAAGSGVASLGHDAGALVLIELEGDAAEVDIHATAVRDLLQLTGASHVEHTSDPDESRRLWQMRKFVSAAVAELMIGKVNEDVCVPRDRISELLSEVAVIAERHQVQVVNFGHLGDGNIHVTFLIDPRVAGERARADAAVSHLFDVTLRLEGTITGEHGVGYTKLSRVEQQLGTEGVALMRSIKNSLDPAGILNPGKKIPAA
jgi:glycolate oxidase